MPLYVSDYLNDTGRLTTEQHGAYLLLILDYWQNGPPPDNNDVLCRIARMSPRSWVFMRPVMERFFTVAGGRWTHPRIDAEHSKATNMVRLARDKASAGGRAKAAKYGQQ